MDNNLDAYKQNAMDASSKVADMTTSAPGLLSQLKQNLVGIFSKDNPIMQQRDQALQGYLNAPSQTRADLLPGGMPQVEGRALTLSPTQQDAIVTARSNAALVPLMGLNDIIRNQYGTIADLVGNAGNIYDSQIKAAQYNASNAMDIYKQEAELQKARESGAGGMGLDFPSILAAISAALTNGTGNNVPSLDDIFALPEPTQDTAAQQKIVKQISNSPIKNSTLPASAIPGINNVKFQLPSQAPANPNSLSIAGNQPSLFQGINMSGLHL